MTEQKKNLNWNWNIRTEITLIWASASSGVPAVTSTQPGHPSVGRHNMSRPGWLVLHRDCLSAVRQLTFLVLTGPVSCNFVDKKQTRLAACRAFRLCTAIVYCCWLHDDELDVASRWLCSCSWVRWWCACDEELCVTVWWRWWVMTMLMLTVTLVLSVGRCSARSLVVSSAVWCCVTLYYCNVYVYESSSKAACQVVSFGVDHISWYVDATSATLSMSTAQFALCLSVDTTDAVTAASWL